MELQVANLFSYLYSHRVLPHKMVVEKCHMLQVLVHPMPCAAFLSSFVGKGEETVPFAPES